MKSLKIVLLGVFLIFLSACAVFLKQKKEVKQKVLSVIPKPEMMQPKEGFFPLNVHTPLVVHGEAPQLETALTFWRDFLEKAWHQRPEVRKKQLNSDTAAIHLWLLEPNEMLAEEGYWLQVTPKQIEIKASSAKGLFYAFQTLRQLLPPEFEQGNITQSQVQIPCVIIKDRPRFVWRGMMLDVSRHFFPKEFIKSFIDYLALHKMNRFHWHLCDDQGWRIEIKKYPKLTEIGAWRVDREDQPWRMREEQKPGEKATYGGFYTQEDIMEIVEYAQQRFVTIVPEIEMPGHTRAALAAYPQFSCTGGPFTVLPGGYWPIQDIYCAGNDSTFLFLQDVLDEVMALFPGDYIHIGGDEVDKTNWKACPKCQKRMKEEGLQTEEELQSYFIKRIEAYINAKGKKLIGWDEILEGGLAPRATVMSWRGFEGGVAAAQSGHDVIMTPTAFCYFDYYQGSRQLEPEAIGGFLPLSKVYQFEPVPADLSSDEAKHILGGQANLWTEFVPTPEHAQYMIFPRIAAMAEALWSPQNVRSWENFSKRLPDYFKRLDFLKINYAKSAFNVQVNSQFDTKHKTFFISLHSELPFVEIHYRLDGGVPNLNDPLYTKPFKLNKSVELSATSFWNSKQMGKVTRETLVLHKATGKPVTLTNAFAEKYSGNGLGARTLTNSLNGSLNFNDGRWLGFEQVDFEAVIDLGTPQTIQNIEVGFLNDVDAWIFLPKQVEFFIAQNKKTFQRVGAVQNQLPEKYTQRERKVFQLEFAPQQARYIRVRAQNIGQCPDWHMGAGGKAWLFVDEIVVK